MRRKIIIDTDPGLDDALAIMLAVKSNAFTIQAITTVCGNTSVENATRNAMWILKTLEVNSIPLYSGSNRPLRRELETAQIHGTSGLAGINPKNKPSLTKNAVTKIIEIAKTNPNITIIALGPLTNIAKAIRKDPETMRTIKEIIIMGGAIAVAGNKNRVAEFNMFVDPEAADIVFRFPIKKTLVPLDACNQVDLTLDDFKKIKNPKISRAVLSMMQPYIKNLEKIDGIKNAIMYDPLTVFTALFPNKVKSEKFDLAVETCGNQTRGMTVPEYRPKYRKNNIEVAMDISKTAFIEYFIKMLSSPSLHHSKTL